MTVHLTIDLRAVILGFVLLLVAAGIATPFAISLADDGPADETSNAQRAVLGTAFTYQGQLNLNGTPANGPFNLRFTLFSDGAANAVVAGPLTMPAVNVANGLFAVDLDFGGGPGVFDGNARWLGIEVQQGAGVFEQMTPRQALNPTPYALYSLGAPWSGITGKPFGFADNVDNDTQYTPGEGLALNNVNQFSVQFLAAGPINGNMTIAARSDHTHVNQTWTDSIQANSSGGKGILTVVNTFVPPGFGLSMGLKGEANSAGVLGVVPAHGFDPGTDLNSFFGGVVGTDRSIPCTGLCVGVSGFANGTSGSGFSVGVNGAGGSIGVLGRGFGATSTGVKGVQPSAQGYAGFFEGRVEVTGQFTNPSDLSLKHDVQPLPYGLDAVSALKPVSYVMNGDESNTTRLGLVAQDVLPILPELVIANPENGLLSMNYLELIPVLIKAIQEQQAQIEALTPNPSPDFAGEGSIGGAPEPLAPTVTVIRQSVGPSNTVSLFVGATVLVFALAVLAHGLMSRRRPTAL